LDIIEMDKNTIMDSLNSNFKDFEDALQNFSAVNNGTINVILKPGISKTFKKVSWLFSVRKCI